MLERIHRSAAPYPDPNVDETEHLYISAPSSLLPPVPPPSGSFSLQALSDLSQWRGILGSVLEIRSIQHATPEQKAWTDSGRVPT